MKVQETGDKLAIVLSALCIAHCILLPIALLVLPAATFLMALENEAVHGGLLFSVIPVSAIALYFGYRKHHEKNLVMTTGIGILILIGAFFAHDIVGESGEVLLTLIGSILLTVGHLKNYRLSAATA